MEVKISAETGLNCVSGKFTGRDEGGRIGGSVVVALRTVGIVLEPFLGARLSFIVGILG